MPDQAPATVTYRESPPAADLADVVEAMWRVEGAPGTPLRILADACTDLIALEATAASVLFVGPMTRADVTVLHTPITVGLRLRPGVYLDADGQGGGLKALRDVEVRMKNPRPATTPAEGLLGCLRALREEGRVSHHQVVDELLTRFREAAEASPSRYYPHSGVSERTAQRLFDHYVGLTPRQTIRVLRHVGIGRVLRVGTDSIAELAAEHGFADQSHLTRDFAGLAGIPPARFADESRTGGFVQD